MEDILASIRRILSEDEAEAAAPSATPGESHPPREPDVLTLDPSMLVEEPPPYRPPPVPSAPRPPQMARAVEPPPLPALPPPVAAMKVAEPMPEPEPPNARPESLLGDAATAAASSSVGSLLRTLVSERQQVAVHRGGPTIEDLVREEVRALLKQWLDSNLPPLVERLVRAEIERLVGRALS